MADEFEGQGGEEEQQISGYVRSLAQEVYQQLVNWMDGGALTDTMVKPMVDLLNHLFVDFERCYMQSLKVDELNEEKKNLQKLLHDTREKYQSTVEVGSISVLIVWCKYTVPLKRNIASAHE